MQEYNQSPEIRVEKSKLLLWLENFWYHYKIHTLIALFFIFTLTVCISQCAGKESYDVYFMYAGDYEVKMTADEGGIPEIKTISSVLKEVSTDRNGDGEVTVSVLPLYYLTSTQITEENARLKGQNSDDEVNVTLVMQNGDTLASNLLMSNYYIVFLSPEVYESYKEWGKQGYFTEVSPYLGEYEVETYDNYAVKLSSLPIYEEPGIQNLPSDTLVTLRILSDVAKRTDRNSAEIYSAAEETFRNLISYKQ